MPEISLRNSRGFGLTGIIIAVAAVVVLLGGWWWFASRSSDTSVSYSLTTVERGDLIVSVSGSGQVTAENQVDLKAQASGDLTYVGVSKGQKVTAGEVIARVDSRDAYKAVRDAQDDLETARLNLEEMLEPTDELTLMQAEDALTNAKEAKESAEEDLVKAYDDAFNAVVDAFLDLPDVMSGLHEVLYGNTASGGVQANLDYYTDRTKIYDSSITGVRNNVDDLYQTVRLMYERNFDNYNAASRYDDHEAIEALLDETYETCKALSEVVKSTGNFIQFYKDTLTQRDKPVSSVANTHLNNLGSYTGQVSSCLSSLLTRQRTIDSDQQAIVSAERTIIEKELSYAKQTAGPDDLDLRSQNLTIRQREETLADAQADLADYVVRAPYDGIIADVEVQRGDTVSTSTVIATLITEQQVAEITLNEIDAVLVKAGQRATLTFDAVEDLTISGQMVDVDSLATTSQGVVSYGAKVALDTQDERVKPGMNVSASIIVDRQSDILKVSSSAIKSSGSTYYVEVLPAEATAASGDATASLVKTDVQPTAVVIEIGLANDTETEVTSGLAEGDQIIARTVQNGGTSGTTQTRSVFSSGNGGPPMMMR